jgi:acyl carrier protein
MRARIKTVIIESLGLEGMTPEMIEDEAPLFGDGLGLDSVDALELMVVLEKDFGVQIDNQEIDPEAFASVASLERFVRQLQSPG